MAGVRRRGVDARTASDVKLLPLSDKRPVEEPMISPHSQQLLVAPMDQAPSSEKAIWLYEAGQVPDNIARILGRSELELLLRVLNRELVESQIFIEAALRTPAITKRTLRAEWDEYRSSEQRLRRVLGGVCLALTLMVIIGAATGVALLVGIACGLMIEVGIVFFFRDALEGGPQTLAYAYILIPALAGIPLILLGIELIQSWSWLRILLISAGGTLAAWFPVVGTTLTYLAYKIHPLADSRATRLGKRLLDEDSAAIADPALLDLESSANSSPGKYFRLEWRVPVLFAAIFPWLPVTRRARSRILHALDYVTHRAMAIHPELLWSVEEFTCKVPVAEGPPVELTLPVIWVSDSGGPPNMEDLHPQRSVITPFSAFVHHASQPNAETGETLVDVDMMHARRRAFLKLHGMEGGAVPTDKVLPPMGEAVEEMVRQHRKPLSSALAQSRQQEAASSNGAEPGRSLWDSGGGYGGATAQYNPLVGGAAEEEAAKKKVAGDGSGTAGPHVV